MNAFITHFIFDFKSGLRDKTLLMMNYLLPLGFYMLMGLVMTKINPDFSANLVPAMTIFAILASTALGMPNILVNGRESGIFRSYKINGVSSISILGIPALAGLVHISFVTLIIFITGPILFGGVKVENLLGFIVVFLAITFAATGLALLIGVISKDSRVTVLWSQLLFTPSMLLGGLTIPSNMLPGSLIFFGKLLPTTYAMNAFKNLAYNQPADFNVPVSILILVAGGLLSSILALLLFKWDNNDRSELKNPAFALIALIPYILGAIFL